MTSRSLSLAAAALATVTAVAEAGSIQLAKNAVNIGGKPATTGAQVQAGAAVSSSRAARAELGLGTRGSVVRFGEKTQSVLNSDTSLTLSCGLMLASSGGSLLREGVSIDCPLAASTVKGTMLVAYQPDAWLKVTCLEGSVTVSLHGLAGDKVRLSAGQIVIINPAKAPLVHDIDLQALAASTALLGADFSPLAASGKIASSASASQGQSSPRPDDAIASLRGMERGVERLRRLPEPVVILPPEPVVEAPRRRQPAPVQQPPINTGPMYPSGPTA